MNYPRVFFLVSFLLLWLAAQFGTVLRRRRALKDEEREDFGVVQAATLTLLGLIIGFTFSMAISRYDQRKTYEEEEANAIGTEYVRAELLPTANAAAVRAQLKRYLDLRIAFYRTRNKRELQQIDADTTQLQTEMWSAVQAPAVAQPTPVIALAVAGMNDVLNSQGYTQAAWWNRIPGSAWSLNDSDRHLLQLVGRLWCPQYKSKGRRAFCAAAGGLHRVPFDRRHRQPA